MSNQHQQGASLADVDPEKAEYLKSELNKIIGVPFQKRLNGEDVKGFIYLKTMDDKIEKLNKLLVEAEGFDDDDYLKLQNLILKQSDFLKTASLALLKGTFFSSLDDVWDVETMGFDDVDINSFNRDYSVEIERFNEAGEGKLDRRYAETTKGAANFTDYTLVCSGRSKSETTASKTPNTFGTLNIFGAKDSQAQSAHLMPHSPNCATFWYHFVGWVLKADDFVSWSDNDRWTYMQMCIHGFALRKKEGDLLTGSQQVGETGNANCGLQTNNDDNNELNLLLQS
jgi:hypothetical protein